jgi:hypothetical protein
MSNSYPKLYTAKAVNCIMHGQVFWLVPLLPGLPDGHQAVSGNRMGMSIVETYSCATAPDLHRIPF